MMNCFDFICETGTHTTDMVEDAEIDLKNCQIIRCDSISAHTGGVILYIKENWEYEILKTMAIEKRYGFC